MRYRFTSKKATKRAQKNIGLSWPIMGLIAGVPALLSLLVIMLTAPQPGETLAKPLATATALPTVLPALAFVEAAAMPTPEPAPPSQPRTATVAQVPLDVPAQIELAAPQKQLPNVWSVELYPDRDQAISPLNGGPIYPGRFKLEWYAKGISDLPSSNFRVVFTGEFDFDQTRSYLFVMNVKGIARVFIDNIDAPKTDAPKIDAYRIGVKRPVVQRVPLSAGRYLIRVEYYSDGGPASLTLNWDADGKRNDYWLGRYYNNELMSPPVAMIRHDNTLTFDWADAPGEGVNSDNFSVQWLREVVVPKNGYTCRMSVNEADKVRVYMDGLELPELSNWDEPNTWGRTAKIPSGRHLFEVQFVHRSGTAKIHLICEL